MRPTPRTASDRPDGSRLAPEPASPQTLRKAPLPMSSTDPQMLLNQALSRLRAEQPQAEQWKALCEFLSGCKLQEQAHLSKALMPRLRGFPDAVRSAPSSWLTRLHRGERVPALYLARALAWKEPGLDDQGLIDLLQHPELRRMRSLKLFGQTLSSRSACWIAQAPQCARLESLNLTSNQIDSLGFRALIESENLTALRRLFLGRNLLCDDDADWITSIKTPLALELLDLRDNPFSPHMLAQLSEHFATQSVELRLESPPRNPGLARRKRGRPSKKKPR